MPVPGDVPNPQLPVAQRLRVRYAKRERLRFASHRDFARAFERAVRRAALPVAYSAGFHPHPRISYAGAAPTGAASRAEYLELALTRRCEPEEVRAALDQALPPGLDVIAVAEAGGGHLNDLLQVSEWRVELHGIPVDELRSALREFLAHHRVEVSRLTNKGMRSFDCRAAVERLTVTSAEPLPACAILTMVVRHGTPSVRPDDVLAGLGELTGFRPPVAALFDRTAQGPFDPSTGTVGDPLASDRDTP